MDFILFLLLLIPTLFIGSIYIKKNNTSFFIIISICLIIYACTREIIDFADGNNYIHAYKYGNVRMEYFFHVFRAIGKNFDSIRLFISIFAITAIGLKCYCIKKYMNEFCMASLLLYTVNSYILHDLVQIRAGLSLSFIIYSLHFLFEKKYVKYIIYILIASCAHHTALIALIFIFLDRENISKFWFIVIPIGYIIWSMNIHLDQYITYYNIGWVVDRYQSYMDKSAYANSVNVFNVKQLLNIAIAYFLLYKSSDFYKYSEYFILFLKIYIIALFILPAFSSFSVIGFRICELFEPINIFLIPLLIPYFKDYGYRSTGIVLTWGISITYLYINIILLNLYILK